MRMATLSGVRVDWHGTDTTGSISRDVEREDELLAGRAVRRSVGRATAGGIDAETAIPPMPRGKATGGTAETTTTGGRGATRSTGANVGADAGGTMEGTIGCSKDVASSPTGKDLQMSGAITAASPDLSRVALAACISAFEPVAVTAEAKDGSGSAGAVAVAS